MNGRAVVLDLDGTLVDTAPDLAAATNHVLGQHGRRPVSLDEIRVMVGQGARKMLLKGFAATGEPLPEERIEPLYADFVAFYRDHIAERSSPFPGAVAFLDLCRAAGIRLAICTNKLEALSVKLLGELGLAGYFGAVIGSDTLGIAKPDAAPYREAVRRAGGRLASSVMIGDSATDVLMAKAAGVPVIAVTFGYTERPVAESRPDYLVDGFDEVWPLVTAIFMGEAAAQVPAE
jgi:phosphoglycolate phosphatase